MGGHRHSADTAGRHAGPVSEVPALVQIPAPRSSAVPSRPVPLPPPPLTGVRGPATGSSRGPATGSSRGPATGSSRGPATGSSRGPATGSRRAPGRRDLRWVPIALSIWIASFLAVPAAVLVHEAVSGDAPAVESTAETRTGTGPDTAPAASTSSTGTARPGAGEPGTAAVRVDGVEVADGVEATDDADPAAASAPVGSTPPAAQVAVVGGGAAVSASPSTAVATVAAGSAVVPTSPAATDSPAAGTTAQPTPEEAVEAGQLAPAEGAPVP